MANKLFPPLIDGTLPAFYLNYDSTSSFLKSTSITISFTMNASVGEAQVKGLSLRLRTVGSGTAIFEPIFSDAYSVEAGNESATFILTPAQSKKLVEGQYYKAQIAYCGSRMTTSGGTVIGQDIGYYSTVGIIKCTSKPKLSIKNLSEDAVNFFTTDFYGVYDQSECRDQTEKVYSYEFIVYDEKDEVYFTTGELLHKTYQDTDFTSSIDRVSLNDFVSNSTLYTIQYKVITLNGLELSTPKYRITSEYLVSPNRDVSIIPVSNTNEGYINITFRGALDLDNSFYIILDERVLDQLDTENGKILTDGGYFTASYYIKMTVNSLPNKLSYLQSHSFYKYYPNGLDGQQVPYYSLLANQPVNYVLWDGYYYRKADYENYMFQYENDMISLTMLNTYKRNLPCYEKVMPGFNTIKRLTYKSVAENYINLDDYFILAKEENETPYYGNFLLSRASDADNYTTWYNLARIQWDNNYPSRTSFKDYTVEHGRTYKYALQQYNIWGLYSARIVSAPYMAVFEDAYLYDGKISLKIKYNPTVDSFKTTILEQKTDTLGGKYPFITRNGATYYKEFPIGGLLAAETDTNFYFVDPQYMPGHRHSSSDLGDEPSNVYRNYHFFLDENIALEKDFKLRVLEWLNDGQPKLFKSPYEGNYIVRLLNNSLTPVKELGRMLHSFTSQAYEIAECNYENLVAFGFLKVNQLSDYAGLWRSYNLADYNTVDDIVIDFGKGVQSFTIQDMMPGDKIYLTLTGQAESVLPIMIGITGSYSYFNIDSKITKIRIPQRVNEDGEEGKGFGSKMSGIISVCYEGIRITAFDAIVGMQLKTILGQQYIGVSPWASGLRTKQWQTETNLIGITTAGLSTAEYNDLQNYNVRDYLDDILQLRRDSNGVSSSISYEVNNRFVKLMKSFDPGEILDRINATINKGEANKIKLVNIEMLRLSERPVIPVYTQQDPSMTNVLDSYYIEGQYKSPLEIKPKTGQKLYVSTDPWGYPHPIEDLVEIEMLDPFCIFKVMRLNRTVTPTDTFDAVWVPFFSLRNNDYTFEEQVAYGEQRSYYDPYYRDWLPEKYDPVAKINYQWKSVAFLKRYATPEEAVANTDDSLMFMNNTKVLTLKNNEQGRYEKELIQNTEALRNALLDPETQVISQDYLMLRSKSRELYRESIINHDNLRKKENNEYYNQAINESRMFDYEIFTDPLVVSEVANENELNRLIYDNTTGTYQVTAAKYYYKFDNNNPDLIKVIDQPESSFFLKVNDEYFANDSNNTLQLEKVYWIKEYDTVINLATDKKVEYHNLKDINSIHIGNGVLAEMNFQIRVLDYYTEIADEEVRAAKEAYLEAKQFYDSLMELYNIILVADGNRQRYYALTNLYNKLLYGKTQLSQLSVTDKNIIRQLLAQPEEKADLNLLKLYKITEINGALDQGLVDALIDFKNKESNAEIEGYNNQYAKFYTIYDEDIGVVTEVIDINDHNFMIVDYNNNTATIRSRVNGNIQWDPNTDKNKTLYKFTDAISGETYSYLVDKVAMNVTDNETVKFDRITNAVSKIDKITFQQSNGGSTILEYSYNDELQPFVERHELLTLDEYDIEKVAPHFINIEEDASNSAKALWEEQGISDILSTAQGKEEIKGVQNKFYSLGAEITKLENNIQDLNSQLSTDFDKYKKYYDNLLNDITTHNNLVYRYWASLVIAKLADKNLTIQKLKTANASTINLNSSFANAIQPYITNNQFEFAKLEDTFIHCDDELEELITEEEKELEKYYTAGINLCNQANSFLSSIEIYQRMIEDYEEENSTLDTYLNKQLIIFTGNYVICYIGAIEAQSKFEALYNALKDDDPLKSQYSSQLNLLAYNINLLEQTKLLKQIKFPQIKFSQTIYESYHNSLLSKFLNMQIFLTNVSNNINVSQIAQASNIYDDLKFLSQNIKSYSDTLSPLPLSIRDPSTNEQIAIIDPFVDTTINLQILLSESQKQQFNTYKDQSTYYYRQIFDTINDSSVTKTENNIPYYIFNIGSKKLVINTTSSDSPYKTFYNFTKEDYKDASNNQYKFELLNTVYHELMAVGAQLMQECRNDSSITIVNGKANLDDIEDWFTKRASNAKDALNGTSTVQNTIDSFDNFIQPIAQYLGGTMAITIPGINNLLNYEFKSNGIKEQDSALRLGVIAVKTAISTGSTSWWPSDINNQQYKHIYLNRDELHKCTDIIQNGDEEALEEFGIYYEYANLGVQNKIDDNLELLRQAQNLYHLYGQQLNSYIAKYNNYDLLFQDNKKTYESYFGTKAYEYYRLVNDSEISTEAKTEQMKQFRNDVRTAWWYFLSLLDAKYTDERKRGMYK